MQKAFEAELIQLTTPKSVHSRLSLSETDIGQTTHSQCIRSNVNRQNNGLSDSECDSVHDLRETLVTVAEALDQSFDGAKKTRSKEKLEVSEGIADFKSVSKTPRPDYKQLNDKRYPQEIYGFHGITMEQLLEIKNTISALEHCVNRLSLIHI